MVALRGNRAVRLRKVTWHVPEFPEAYAMVLKLLFYGYVAFPFHGVNGKMFKLMLPWSW